MDADDILQQQSRALLQRLKTKQGTLQKLVCVESSRRLSPSEEVCSTQRVCNNDANLKVTIESCQKAKEQLSSKSKLSQGLRDTSAALSGNQRKKGGYRQEVFSERDASDKRATSPETRVAEHVSPPILGVERDQTEVLKHIEGSSTPIMVKLSENVCEKSPITPNSVSKRRRIIDRNIHVRVGDGNSAADQDVDSGLNYSYSKLDNSDLNRDDKMVQVCDHVNDSGKIYDWHDRPKTGDKESYAKKLRDDGNDKKMASFVRDTSFQPKSILASPGPHGPKKRNGTNGTVSFRQSTHSGRTSPSFLEDTTSRKLLGYDWIAGLLDNDPTVIDQSEAFFDELRDFRRVNRDECENKSYMEGPLSIVKSMEETTIKQALDRKVKPFMINERLFTVPVQNDWMANAVGEATNDVVENKEPSYEAPRFVRVSIPRSTLLSPYRVKPHRRRSFDPTDTMALGEHCLMGWDSSRPSVMPAASNVALKDASRGVKTKIATTLEEAEKIASSFYWPNSAPPPAMTSTNHRLAEDSILQLRYASLLNRSQIQERLEQTGLTNKSTSLPGQANRSTDLSITSDSKQFSCFPPGGRNQSTSLNKSCTDQLLDTTYSLMYELERLRQDADKRLQPNVGLGVQG